MNIGEEWKVGKGGICRPLGGGRGQQLIRMRGRGVALMQAGDKHTAGSSIEEEDEDEEKEENGTFGAFLM